MTSFNHILTGVTIAATVKNPVLAPILAFVSHFLLDALPHWADPRAQPWSKPFMAYLFVDTAASIGAIVLGCALFPDQIPLILVCSAAATCPDWLWILHYGFGVKHKFFEFHQAIQRFEKPWGIYFEVPYTTAIVWLLFFLSNN